MLSKTIYYKHITESSLQSLPLPIISCLNNCTSCCIMWSPPPPIPKLSTDGSSGFAEASAQERNINIFIQTKKNQTLSLRNIINERMAREQNNRRNELRISSKERIVSSNKKDLTTDLETRCGEQSRGRNFRGLEFLRLLTLASKICLNLGHNNSDNRSKNGSKIGILLLCITSLNK
jgi:hypothetical protein